MGVTKHPVEPGMRFGSLTAIRDAGRDEKGRSLWLFRCDCGSERIMRRTRVATGGAKSCGCKKVSALELGRNSQKHGMAGTRIYRCWQSMRNRCSAKDGRYKRRYADRGITVCEEWNRFEPFYEWAMSHGYAENLTLDRINNSGIYEPNNCRWATAKEQANNRW